MIYAGGVSIPVIIDRLNDEAEGGADGVDILAHYLFHNRGFARIVETAASRLALARASSNEESCVRHTASRCATPYP
jgi:hypothetical protein